MCIGCNFRAIVQSVFAGTYICAATLEKQKRAYLEYVRE